MAIYRKETSCRVCSGADLVEILAFGASPLADRLLTKSHLAEPGVAVPLTLMFCSGCSLVQIAETPKGEILNAPKKLKPTGDASARVEAARGDMHCYVVGDGGAHAYRARFRTGSFDAMAMIREKSRGLMVADLVALIASLDVVAPEIDR